MGGWGRRHQAELEEIYNNWNKEMSLTQWGKTLLPTKHIRYPLSWTCQKLNYSIQFHTEKPALLHLCCSYTQISHYSNQRATSTNVHTRKFKYKFLCQISSIYSHEMKTYHTKQSGFYFPAKTVFSQWPCWVVEREGLTTLKPQTTHVCHLGNEAGWNQQQQQKTNLPARFSELALPYQFSKPEALL